MRDREKLSNIEALANYLLDRADEKSIDEHWQNIYDAQTKKRRQRLRSRSAHFS